MKLTLATLLPLVCAAVVDEHLLEERHGWGSICPPKPPPSPNGERWYRIAYGPRWVPCHSNKEEETPIIDWIPRGTWIQLMCQDNIKKGACGDKVMQCFHYKETMCCVLDAWIETGYHGWHPNVTQCS